MKKRIAPLKKAIVRALMFCLTGFTWTASADGQGSIVQNGNFQSVGDHWAGNIPFFLGNWPTVPNGFCAMALDIYQDLATAPGQQYLISFDAAADLYVAPSVVIALSLNNQVAASFTTPPYTYNPNVNRYDQMHWEQFTSSFVASAGTTRLEFIETNAHDFGLTSVSVIAAPEPTSVPLILMAGAAMGITRNRQQKERRVWPAFYREPSPRAREPSRINPPTPRVPLP